MWCKMYAEVWAGDRFSVNMYIQFISILYKEVPYGTEK